jgi:ectoine hydroxylase-related dioxygenase (phytanoyl-CoA dioxygenase family)
LEHDPHELGLQVRAELLADGTLDPAGGQLVLAKAGSFIVFQVTTIHASTPNYTGSPRRLCIFAHCPQSLFVPQIHPGNQNAVIREGALEADYLRRVASGMATPVARL